MYIYIYLYIYIEAPTVAPIIGAARRDGSARRPGGAPCTGDTLSGQIRFAARSSLWPLWTSGPDRIAISSGQNTVSSRAYTKSHVNHGTFGGWAVKSWMVLRSPDFLGPIATRPPRSDVFSQSDCDPGPSKCRVFSVRLRPGPLLVTCFLGPVATRNPRRDLFSRSDCNPDPSK